MDTKWKNINLIRPFVFLVMLGAILHLAMLMYRENLDRHIILDMSKSENYIESESFQQLIYDVLDEINQVDVKKVEEENATVNVNRSVEYTAEFWASFKRLSNVQGEQIYDKWIVPGIWLEYSHSKLKIKNNTDYCTDALKNMKFPYYAKIKKCFLGLDEEGIYQAGYSWNQVKKQVKNAFVFLICSCIVWISLVIYMSIKRIKSMSMIQWIKSLKDLLQKICFWIAGSIHGITWYKKGLVQTEKIRTEVATIALMLFGGVAIYNLCRQQDTFLQDVIVVVCVGGIFCVLFLYFQGSLSIAKRYVDMQNKIHTISQEHFQSQEEKPGLTPFAQELEQLDRIGVDFEENLENKIKAERTKVELVTNVSHDLKTPLTSVISYIDLLQRMDNLPLEAREYVNILEQKSERLRAIVSDVFELAKTTSGEIKLEIQKINVNKLLMQTLVSLEDKIAVSELVIKTHFYGEELYIDSDGQRLYRVLQNLIDNALKYSLKGTRIFLTEEKIGERVEIILKNTANYEMDFSAEDVMERFFCGDKSRNTEGNGLGLSIAQGFTVACGGEFQVKIDGDQFQVKISFPISHEEELQLPSQ